MAFLTTAAPTWNNWARNPSFVVVMQDLQAYLCQRDSADDSRLVGEPLELTLDPAQYQPQVRFVTPQRRRIAHGHGRCRAECRRQAFRRAYRHRRKRHLRGPAYTQRQFRRDSPLRFQRRSGRGQPGRLGQEPIGRAVKGLEIPVRAGRDVPIGDR